MTTLDAHDLQSLFQAAYEWLGPQLRNRQPVQRLPLVPDGDTGTNMLLTIKSAWANIANRHNATVGDVAEAVAEGASRIARQPGVIPKGRSCKASARACARRPPSPHDLARALRGEQPSGVAQRRARTRRGHHPSPWRG